MNTFSHFAAMELIVFSMSRIEVWCTSTAEHHQKIFNPIVSVNGCLCSLMCCYADAAALLTVPLLQDRTPCSLLIVLNLLTPPTESIRRGCSQSPLAGSQYGLQCNGTHTDNGTHKGLRELEGGLFLASTGPRRRQINVPALE